MNQHVKYFKGKQSLSNNWFGTNDRGLAEQIERYAKENQLHIDTVAYSITGKFMHAVVVFSGREPIPGVA